MSGHPITPPPELMQQWRNEAPPLGLNREHWIATQAARWGADQQLNADCEWMQSHFHGMSQWSEELRAAMRPKPPSLAEQGQRILVENGRTLDGRVELDPEDVVIISAALERLQQLEQENNG